MVTLRSDAVFMDEEGNYTVYHEKVRQEIAKYLGIQVSHYMMQKYVTPLLESGELRMTHPEKPRSKNQTYVRA